LVGHEPSSTEERRAAVRAYLATGRPELAAQLLELERSLGERGALGSGGSAALSGERDDTPGWQLVAAEIELARGAYARAAQLFAEVPAGSSAHADAQRGLSDALLAQGMPELAAEVRARAAQ
jgi:hypothetical protein